MSTRFYILAMILPALLFAGCRERYDIPLDTPSTGYLVVEGVINTLGKTDVRLSRTSTLAEKTIVPVTGATVQVEGDDNSIYFLSETAEGVYSIDTLALNAAVKYRLVIQADQKNYASTFQPIIHTPPIDSVSWSRQDGVDIVATTHDPGNSIRYYKWDFEETWEIKSTYEANLMWVVAQMPGNNEITVDYFNPSTMQFNRDIITCWQARRSTAIVLGSTAKLSRDIIVKPLVHIPEGSIELGELYSINVKQYGLSREGYEFFEKMKKNSESLGTIFDPQPSEIKGNISCVTDPGEQVIGFVEPASVWQKRIFIYNRDVPNWDYSQGCLPEQVIVNHPDSVENAYGSGLLPTVPNMMGPFGLIIDFKASPDICVDCTRRGTNVKPSFWPR